MSKLSKIKVYREAGDITFNFHDSIIGNLLYCITTNESRSEFDVLFDDNDGGCAGEFLLSRSQYHQMIETFEKLQDWNNYVSFEKQQDTITIYTEGDGSSYLSKTLTSSQFKQLLESLKAIVDYK